MLEPVHTVRDEDGDPVGEGEDRIHVVLDEEHGRPALERTQRLHHLAALHVAEAGHRLVEQQEARFAGERHGELELLLLAVGEVRHPGLGAVGEAARRHVAAGAAAQ